MAQRLARPPRPAPHRGAAGADPSRRAREPWCLFVGVTPKFYDALDRPIRRTILGVGTLYYQCDLAGRRTLIQDWTGDTVYYTYDNRGLISTVHSPAGWTYYQYDPRGAMTKKVLPNATVTYHVYDAAGRITSLADRRSDGTAISTFDFTRDPNGNILTSLREDEHLTCGDTILKA